MIERDMLAVIDGNDIYVCSADDKRAVVRALRIVGAMVEAGTVGKAKQ